MKSNADWRLAQPGVMLYMPATRVSIENTEYSMSQLSVVDDASQGAQSQLSNISDTVLPSCEENHDAQIKEEPVETTVLGFTRDDSPATVAGEDDMELLFDVSPATPPTPGSLASSDILFQLMEAAEGDSARSNYPCVAIAEDNVAISATETFLDICYDSERTDFRESPSPTIRKSKNTTKRTTGAVRRHMKRQTQSTVLPPPIRRLNFGNRLKKQAAKTIKKSASTMSLENLRSIEQAPSHNWDNDERELLCVLHRWYCGRDRTTELEFFAKVFNSITGLDIPPKRVRGQFENHMRLHGAEAYPVLGRVFSIPFDDPEDRYVEIRALIEAEAAALGVDLLQRQADSTVRSGMARFAKSPRTREVYKSLVQKASQEAGRQASQAAEVQDNMQFSWSIATMSMAVRIPADENWELITDVEQTPAPVVESIDESGVSKPALTKPHLTFRVWDSENRTKFIDGNFIAQTFVDWRRPFPAPIALNDPSEAGKIFTVLHLSKEGDTPVYISTASSLLQALSYGMSMQRPQIALINLDAPSLRQDDKLHHAADVFPWLKSHGLARWARYKGNGEYFVWAEIPDDAVLHTLDLEALIRDLDGDTDCHDLLKFDAFDPRAKTNTIAGVLREKNAVLNSATARALGKTAKAFGLSETNVTLEHVQDFVARVMDGWTITKPETIDMHTMSSLAATFATSLGPHAGDYTLQQVMGAFIEGVDQGERCIAHWSRSRSGSRRQRFREA